MSEKERRAWVTELRAASDGRTLDGYAVVFGSRTDLGYCTEEIAPEAMDGVMGDDVRCLFNHDPDNILGRTASGTLRIAKTDKGLRYECDMPDSPIGETVLGAVKRGDVSGNSFSFTVAEDSWDYDGDKPHRTIVRCGALFDVGPVTYPAYAATELSARALEAAMKEKAPPAPAPSHEARNKALDMALSI